jgi:hypothetical protein
LAPGDEGVRYAVVRAEMGGPTSRYRRQQLVPATDAADETVSVQQSLPEAAEADDGCKELATMLDGGEDVDQTDRSRRTALMRAAGALQLANARLLLWRDADVSARDAAGRTALHWAVQAPAADGDSTDGDDRPAVTPSHNSY